jgi:1-acyl-sn-glycerol-3-phosphate acyltransferase
MTKGPYPLPGGRIAAERLRDIPRVAVGAAWLLGPAAWVTIARARRGDARAAEASWARQATKLLGMRIEVIGRDIVDPAERYVIAPLHEGFADAIALLQLPLKMRFVARDELLEWSVLGTALRAGGHVIVEPERGVSAYRELRRRSGDVLTSESLVVFPQGTILGIESAFTGGAFHLARVLDRPLLPVVITGTHRIWEHPYSPVVRFGGSVRLEVLPAVSPEQAVVERRDIERRMKRLALAATPQPRRYEPDRDGWWDGYRFQIDPDFPELAARVDQHRRQEIAAGGSGHGASEPST